MWAGQWSGRELWDAFWKGSIYLSFFTQLDCITILNRESGQGRADIDFATSLVPQGCSITLDKSRKTLRQGGHRVTTGGWWWGIPQQWMDPVTAYRLARFITNRENQVMECKRFGMVPVRNDVIRDPVALFSGGPVSDVFRTSYRQMQENNNCVLPGNKLIDTVSRCYLDAWKRIAVEKQWSEKASMPPKEEYIEAVLKKHFSPRVMKIAAGKK